MRIAYLDESGTGSLNSDPFLVVAGVIVDADAQAVKLTDALYKILHTLAPRGARIPKYLHAKDIFHGKKDFNKAHWSSERRQAILKALSLCPVAHGANVVYGSVDRGKMHRDNPGVSIKRIGEIAYAKAAALCIINIERFMRNSAGANEIASITFEHGAKGAALVKEVYHMMRRPDGYELGADVMEFLPLTRIIDAPNFQEKNDSSILQLADYCAFALKRREDQSAGWEALCEEFLRFCVGKWEPKGAAPVG